MVSASCVVFSAVYFGLENLGSSPFRHQRNEGNWVRAAAAFPGEAAAVRQHPKLASASANCSTKAGTLAENSPPSCGTVKIVTTAAPAAPHNDEETAF